MTWLWERLRSSLRNGRFRIGLQKFLEPSNTNQLASPDDENSDLNEESEEEDSFAYFGVCSACKLAINHYRSFNFSPVSLLSARTSCPFCGLRYSDVVESDGRPEFREQRTGSDPSVGSQRLPPIYDSQSENTRVRSCENDIALIRRLENLNMILSPNSRMSLFLPPISKEQSSMDFRRRCSLEMKQSQSTLSLRDEFLLPNYPVRHKTRQEFLNDIRKAKQYDNYNNLQKFYSRTFGSFSEICALFKNDFEEEDAKLEDPGLKMEFIYSVNDAIEQLPTMIHKTVLQAIINSLLEESKILYDKDDIRAVFILLQCPIFAMQNSYIVFAHLLRFSMNLPSSHHKLLVSWFKILDIARLRGIIRRIMQFITVRQFAHDDKTLPSLSKSTWWIPTATKLLALINAANNESSPSLLHYTELYNSALDHIDLMQDYYVWQNCRHPGQFAYCQYPFVLSILAKRMILTKDSEQQMILNARRSLVAKMTRRQTPQIDIFFLNINVRRANLVNDSLNEITCKQKDLKKKLKVSFVGEPGLDMGGLTKEWFMLLVREIFHSNYGMFVYHAHSNCYWFSTDNREGNLKEYNLIGVLMGLAVYNSNILDLHFPSICYRKLLTPPVVPSIEASERIGRIESVSLDDLNEIMPDVARGLKELLAYDGNVEEDMYMHFEISLEEFGAVKTFPLKQDGEKIAVTNENRAEYVHLYLQWILNTAIHEQFKAFYLGFHSVCASNALIMLRGEEIEMLVCGSQPLNLGELRKVTEYDGFDDGEEFIEHFWEIIDRLDEDLKKKFLLFTTGSDRIPVGGVSEMAFKISRLPHKIENLPEAHTCFNQLVLPRYENKITLKEKLITAISNTEGFGLE